MLSLSRFRRIGTLLIAAAAATPLAAQSPGGVHPSVAPPAPGFVWPGDWQVMSTGVVHPGRSPVLNSADRKWNHGESATERDKGGIFGMNLGNQMAPVVPVLGTNVHMFASGGPGNPPEGWLATWRSWER